MAKHYLEWARLNQILSSRGTAEDAESKLENDVSTSSRRPIVTQHVATASFQGSITIVVDKAVSMIEIVFLTMTGRIQEMNLHLGLVGIAKVIKVIMTGVITAVSINTLKIRVAGIGVVATSDVHIDLFHDS